MKFRLVACLDGNLNNLNYFFSIDVIVRNEMTERAKPGDKCVFTGTLIVIPDVAQLLMPGSKIERGGEFDPRRSNTDTGVGGLKALGVRELTYKLAFLSCMVQTV
jgi:DNA replication licensing factor MCM6